MVTSFLLTSLSSICTGSGSTTLPCGPASGINKINRLDIHWTGYWGLQKRVIWITCISSLFMLAMRKD